jgi:hypothetical protein
MPNRFSMIVAILTIIGAVFVDGIGTEYRVSVAECMQALDATRAYDLQGSPFDEGEWRDWCRDDPSGAVAAIMGEVQRATPSLLDPQRPAAKRTEQDI